MVSRQEAIEAIVAELKNPGYGQILVVSPDHQLSVALQEETYKALGQTPSRFRRSMASISISLRSALFVAGTKPERVVGFGTLKLLVIEKWAELPTAVSRVLEGYNGVPLAAFS